MLLWYVFSLNIMTSNFNFFVYTIPKYLYFVGRLDDYFIIQFMKDKLLSMPCQNQVCCILHTIIICFSDPTATEKYVDLEMLLLIESWCFQSYIFRWNTSVLYLWLTISWEIKYKNGVYVHDTSSLHFYYVNM